MQALRLTLIPQTAFGTPLVGDTLFGHLCWNIAEAYGVARLRDLLDGYTAGAPFLIASDAFPAGYLPLPTLRILGSGRRNRPQKTEKETMAAAGSAQRTRARLAKTRQEQQ